MTNRRSCSTSARGCATSAPAGRAIGPSTGTALLTHLHWDHVQGLPFFVPLLRDGAHLDVYAPAQEDGRSVHEAFDAFLRPPYFPVTLEHLVGRSGSTTCWRTSSTVGGARVVSRLIPHCGPTLGYRVTWDGVTVAYLSDHQQPSDGSYRIAPAPASCARAPTS